MELKQFHCSKSTVIRLGPCHAPYVHQIKLCQIGLSSVPFLGATGYRNGAFTKWEAF